MLKVMDPKQNLCPFCNFSINETFYFCPNCGRTLKVKPFSLSKQIGIYALSFFLPPLGFWPAFKYLRQKDEKTKIVGIIALFLSIISTAITIWLLLGLYNQLNQITQYQSLGL
jgi:hypothetical protein